MQSIFFDAKYVNASMLANRQIGFDIHHHSSICIDLPVPFHFCHLIGMQCGRNVLDATSDNHISVWCSWFCVRVFWWSNAKSKLLAILFRKLIGNFVKVERMHFWMIYCHCDCWKLKWSKIMLFQMRIGIGIHANLLIKMRIWNSYNDTIGFYVLIHGPFEWLKLQHAIPCFLSFTHVLTRWLFFTCCVRYFGYHILYSTELAWHHTLFHQINVYLRLLFT